MATRISGAARVIGVIVGALVVAGLGFALAIVVLAPRNLGGGDSAVESALVYPVEQTQDFAASDKREAAGEGLAAPEASVDEASAPVDSKVVRTASMEVRVDDLDAALVDVRGAVKASGGEVTSLSVQSGDDVVGPVEPLRDSGSYSGPATAYVTIRVPADNLDELESDIAGFGTLVSQSASTDDVTEQYVDLSARLKNLKAEEARLRSFFDQAENVEDLLAVQTELSRVRGDIEAMQAQIDYLDRQVARATLNVVLTEPGPVVRPESGDWGFGDAVTRGIQAAAALVNLVIVATIAVLPVVLVVALIVIVVRMILRRRSRRAEPDQDSRNVAYPSDTGSDDDESDSPA